MKTPPDRTFRDKTLGYIQLLWLPLVPLILIPVTRPYAFAAAGCIFVINATNRRRIFEMADENVGLAIADLLRTDESLVEHATATHWVWIGNTVALRPVGYLALTDQRVIYAEAPLTLKAPLPRSISYAENPKDANITGVARGRFTTKLTLDRPRLERLQLSFRQSSRRRAEHLLDLLASQG